MIWVRNKNMFYNIKKWIISIWFIVVYWDWYKIYHKKVQKYLEKCG